MYSLIRKAIFSLDPETAHDLVIKSLHLAGKSPCQFLLKQLLACPQGTPKQVMGITFKNPIGLAAGLLTVTDSIIMALITWSRMLKRQNLMA